MSQRYAGIAVCIAGLVLPFLLSQKAAGAPIASCNASATLCSIPENVLLQLPFTAISGDVVLTEPGSSTVSDVFRIFNNIINTGGGTGLGNMVFMFSSDEGPLPAPGTYSLNVAFLTEVQSNPTPFTGNGTTYLLGIPEPQTFTLFILAVAAMAALALMRSRKLQGDL